MTKCDLFVCFHSDDINPISGDIDENLVKHDEADLDKKFGTIKDLSQKAKGDEGQCDRLLQQCHRGRSHVGKSFRTLTKPFLTNIPCPSLLRIDQGTRPCTHLGGCNGQSSVPGRRCHCLCQT